MRANLRACLGLSNVNPGALSGFWAASGSPSAARIRHEHTTSEPVAGTSLSCLSSRAVIELRGTQALPFLQGMVTNDIRPLGQPNAGPVYAALLTPKGKFLHDPMFHQGKDPGTLLMEVDKSGAAKALDWLSRYKLRRDVQLQDVSEQYTVWAVHGSSLIASPSSSPSPLPSPSQLGDGWWADPRLPELGMRGIFPYGQQPVPPSLNRALNVSESDSIDEVIQLPANSSTGGRSSASGSPEGQNKLDMDERQYRMWRYMHGVAEGEEEIPAEKAAPLDYNFDILNGVSYHKGCYIGQERNSFTHFRGVIRKRCIPFKLTDPDTPLSNMPRDADIVASRGQGSAPSSRAVGSVRGYEGGVGLAYLKLDVALAAAEGGGVSLFVKGHETGSTLTPFRPPWWPKEWGREESSPEGE